MSSHAVAKNGASNESPSWTPSLDKIEKSRLKAFMGLVKEKTGKDFADYESLWRWSIEDIETFWDLLWDFCGVIGERGGVVLEQGDKMPGARFFPKARLNYAENVLRRRDDAIALVFRNEKGTERFISFEGLYEEVARWQAALKDAGVVKGDRVAGYLPNMPETIFAMLATAGLGAIWSSASPDFGVNGVLDRFGQIEPKVLIGVDGYYYNGKVIDCREKVAAVQAQMSSLQKTVIVPFVEEFSDLSMFDEKTVGALDFVSGHEGKDVYFEALPFNHPLFIMFSSGTTGTPKCIVHGHGGTLLQHYKEHQLHNDVKAGDKIFYFTTCGWMMWNWLVTGLASGATLLLYDGSPFYPDGNVLWDYTTAHDCRLFGIGAKFIDAIKAHGFKPKETHDLSAMETICSTGSPLVHESFDYIYKEIKSDVHVASISGGTDIISCFVLGNPISPVYRGEIQGAGLGMAIDVFDDDGHPIAAGGGAGELVCTKPFPCMPVGFWNDPDDTKYRSAYFDTYDNIWHHGDWIEKTAHNGYIIHGRSDATLNPGGVRIGTAEIYRQVEQLDEIMESIVVGQKWDNDVRIVLFVILKDGIALDDALKQKIKQKIRAGATPRHVPAKIIAVTDIPRTKSGKITEIAVQRVIHGREIKNREALANPEALDLYKDLPELQEN